MSNQEFVSMPMTGWFDVKIYNPAQPRDQWKLKGENDNIAFGVTFKADDHAAAPFAKYAKPFEKEGRQMVRVTFKIGGKCKWFDSQAQQVARPALADLDGKRFECCIQYREVEPDSSNPLSPRGYWARAIQYREVADNPFQVMGGIVAGIAERMPDLEQPEDEPNQHIGGDMPLPF